MQAELLMKLHREPTEAEMYQALEQRYNWTQFDYQIAQAAYSHDKISSLDAPMQDDGDGDDFYTCLADPCAADPSDIALDQIQTEVARQELQRVLSKRQYEIIKMYYGLEGEPHRTLQELADYYGKDYD